MSQSARAKERLRANPARFIEQEIKRFVRTSPDNHLSFMNGYAMWDEPLVKFADGDDPIFTEYKSIIAPDHLTPREEELVQSANSGGVYIFGSGSHHKPPL